MLLVSNDAAFMIFESNDSEVGSAPRSTIGQVSAREKPGVGRICFFFRSMICRPNKLVFISWEKYLGHSVSWFVNAIIQGRMLIGRLTKLNDATVID